MKTPTGKYADLFEMKEIHNFDNFESLGPASNARIPPGHTKIKVHLIYDYKQDRRYKARMVASGIMNGSNLDTYYSRVISLCSMNIIFFPD